MSLQASERLYNEAASIILPHRALSSKERLDRVPFLPNKQSHLVNHNNRGSCSKTHYVRADFIEAVVLGEIKRLMKFATKHEDGFAQVVMAAPKKYAYMKIYAVKGRKSNPSIYREGGRFIRSRRELQIYSKSRFSHFSHRFIAKLEY